MRKCAGGTWVLSFMYLACRRAYIPTPAISNTSLRYQVRVNYISLSRNLETCDQSRLGTMLDREMVWFTTERLHMFTFSWILVLGGVWRTSVGAEHLANKIIMEEGTLILTRPMTQGHHTPVYFTRQILGEESRKICTQWSLWDVAKERWHFKVPVFKRYINQYCFLWDTKKYSITVASPGCDFWIIYLWVSLP